MGTLVTILWSHAPFYTINKCCSVAVPHNESRTKNLGIHLKCSRIKAKVKLSKQIQFQNNNLYYKKEKGMGATKHKDMHFSVKKKMQNSVVLQVMEIVVRL